MEDFGDYIYIIAAILFSVVGAINKKRKKTGTPKQSKARDIFETLFDTEAPIGDPVQEQMEYEEEAFIPRPVEPTFAHVDTFAETVDKRRTENVSVVDTGKVATISHGPKNHPLLADFRSHHELQKAVIYAEILKTKF